MSPPMWLCVLCVSGESCLQYCLNHFAVPGQIVGSSPICAASCLHDCEGRPQASRPANTPPKPCISDAKGLDDYGAACYQWSERAAKICCCETRLDDAPRRAEDAIRISSQTSLAIGLSFALTE